MRPLLVPAMIEEARRSGTFLHPLLRHPRGAPSGKLWHAHQISQPFDFYDPLGREGDAERLSPLFSQPVMELCLRIPTYVLTHGGWDRAVARRAFYHDLPPQIRNRRNKGGIEEHLRSHAGAQPRLPARAAVGWGAGEGGGRRPGSPGRGALRQSQPNRAPAPASSSNMRGSRRGCARWGRL